MVEFLVEFVEIDGGGRISLRSKVDGGGCGSWTWSANFLEVIFSEGEREQEEEEGVVVGGLDCWLWKNGRWVVCCGRRGKGWLEYIIE